MWQHCQGERWEGPTPLNSVFNLEKRKWHVQKKKGLKLCLIKFWPQPLSFNQILNSHANNPSISFLHGGRSVLSPGWVRTSLGVKWAGFQPWNPASSDGERSPHRQLALFCLSAQLWLVSLTPSSLVNLAAEHLRLWPIRLRSWLVCYFLCCILNYELHPSDLSSVWGTGAAADPGTSGMRQMPGHGDPTWYINCEALVNAWSRAGWNHHFLHLTWEKQKKLTCE